MKTNQLFKNTLFMLLFLCHTTLKASEGVDQLSLKYLRECCLDSESYESISKEADYLIILVMNQNECGLEKRIYEFLHAYEFENVALLIVTRELREVLRTRFYENVLEVENFTFNYHFIHDDEAFNKLMNLATTEIPISYLWLYDLNANAFTFQHSVRGINFNKVLKALNLGE
jgi:hypothetical protein